MSKTSRIEWTDHTFNPWIGCQKVSRACENCYAETWAKRWRPGQGLWLGKRVRTSQATWQLPRRWNRAALVAGRPALVFCASLADVFEYHAERTSKRPRWQLLDRTTPSGRVLYRCTDCGRESATPDKHCGPFVGGEPRRRCGTHDTLAEWRAELFQLIRETPALRWLLLTKRPENVLDMLPDDWGHGWPNVAIGATVEDQETADARIPHLLRVPARWRFLSCEPLVGPVDLTPRHLDWVIAGGESGPRAAPSHPDWFRSLRDQCAAADVPFFFKQWGAWAPGDAIEANGADWPCMYEELTADGGATAHWWPDSSMRAAAAKVGRPIEDSHGPIGGDSEVLWVGKRVAGRFLLWVGKRVAGRFLDGCIHDGMPDWGPI